VAGVTDVVASEITGNMLLFYDPARTAPAELDAALRELGCVLEGAGTPAPRRGALRHVADAVTSATLEAVLQRAVLAIF
jgi:hypothetical protein